MFTWMFTSLLYGVTEWSQNQLLWNVLVKVTLSNKKQNKHENHMGATLVLKSDFNKTFFSVFVCFSF